MNIGPFTCRWLLAAISLTMATSAPISAQQFEVTDLGTLGGSFSDALMFSGSGVIAGYATTAPSVKHAVLWDDQGITDLGAPAGFVVSSAVAVNGAGQVAGNGEGSQSEYRAYLWESETWTPLGALPGRTDSIARDIDSAGRIVGGSFTPGGGNGAAFLWEAGLLTDLGNLGGTAEAHAINNAGQVVGRSLELQVDSTLESRAFLWEDGAMTSLGVLPGEDYSQALDINNVGDVAGSSWHLTSPNFFSADQAVLWRGDGEIVDLGLTPGPPVCSFNFPFYTDNIARAINSHGDVVGDAACVASGASKAAFYWQDGVMSNLNELVPPGTGWDLLSARDISDDGEIVGLGIAPNGQLHGFLLTPIGPPVAVTPGAPLKGQVLTASPSPFGNSTRVSFDLVAPANVRLTVHDVRGRRIATLTDGIRGAGPQTFSWGGRSELGERLAGGIYFVRLEAGQEVVTRKVVLRR
jgi:probable HAF family extracellular repeat protein